MFSKRILVISICFYSCFIFGQTNIKAMFYNTLNYNSNTKSKNRTIHLKTILDDIKPGLFMVCELKNQTASDYLFTNAVATHNNNFKAASQDKKFVKI